MGKPKVTSGYQCVNANCGRPAMFVRIVGEGAAKVMQPICDSCASWVQRHGGKVVPIEFTSLSEGVQFDE